MCGEKDCEREEFGVLVKGEIMGGVLRKRDQMRGI